MSMEHTSPKTTPPDTTEPSTIEELAGKIAEAVYWNRNFPTGEPRNLLVEFANEIQRKSIEP